MRLMWWNQFRSEKDPETGEVSDAYDLYFGEGPHLVGTILNGKDADMICEMLNKSSALPNTKRHRWR